ncbi:MAG: FHA domain-containing protein, partial [Vicinamibacterales bacterium]
MPTLLITGEDGSERTVELGEKDLRIGRGQENDLVLPDPGKGVSRMHAELRFEHGRYVIIDLNSQNGTWVDGQRVQRSEVSPGSEIALGPYRLRLKGVVAAAKPVDTAVQPAPAAASETMVVPAGRSPVAAPAPPAAQAAPKRPARPAARADVQPGLIAAVARLPKPVIFGAFFAIVLVIVVLGQIFAPSDETGKPASQATTAKPAGETNEQSIARHLTEGKALVEKGDYEAAIRDHFDRILLIDPSHAEATDLKAKADEKLR